MYYVTFENDVFIDPCLDLSYLKEILTEYLEKTDFFQIIVLKEDEENKNFLEEYSAYNEENEYEEIFQGPIDKEFSKELLKEFLNEKNIPKFYDLRLYIDDKIKLEILNYGEEVSLYNFDEEEVQEIYKELLKKYPIKDITIAVDTETTSQTDTEYLN